MKPMLQHVLAISSLLVATLPQTLAYPSGTGGCDGGQPAVASSHLMGQIMTGDLASAGYVVTLDSKPIATGSTVDFVAGADHELVIESSLSPFRGFLLRLGGNGLVTTTDALRTPADATDIRLAQETCIIGGVGGLTHTEPSVKTKVSGILRMDSAATNLPLDVTIVVQNRNGISEFYYSNFTLNALGASQRLETQAPSSTVTSLSPLSPSPSSQSNSLGTGSPSLTSQFGAPSSAPTPTSLVSPTISITPTPTPLASPAVSIAPTPTSGPNNATTAPTITTVPTIKPVPTAQPVSSTLSPSPPLSTPKPTVRVSPVSPTRSPVSAVTPTSKPTSVTSKTPAPAIAFTSTGTPTPAPISPSSQSVTQQPSSTPAGSTTAPSSAGGNGTSQPSALQASVQPTTTTSPAPTVTSLAPAAAPPTVLTQPLTPVAIPSRKPSKTPKTIQGKSGKSRSPNVSLKRRRRRRRRPARGLPFPTSSPTTSLGKDAKKRGAGAAKKVGKAL